MNVGTGVIVDVGVGTVAGVGVEFGVGVVDDVVLDFGVDTGADVDGLTVGMGARGHSHISQTRKLG